MSNLRRKFQNKFEKKQDIPYTVSGKLGNSLGAVKVPNRDNYVYVRLAGAGVAEVFNNRVTAIFDLPVICGYDPIDPQRFQVLSIQGATVDAVGGYLSPSSGYAPSDRYRWMFPGGGQDPLFVELRQWLPLRITLTGGMRFIVHNQVIWTGTAWITFGGSTETDLTSLIPATAGKCCMVLVSINTSGALVTTKGTEVNIADLVVTNIPSPPVGTQYVLGAIRLYNGQTVIQEARTNTDVSDLRFPQVVPEALADGLSINAKEEDGNPNISGVNTLIFPNGYLTDNVDGSVSVAYPSPYSLTVEEVDGTPSVSGVNKIVVTNGSLTDNSTGTVILTFGAGGGGSLPGVEIDLGSFAADTADIDGGSFV